MSPNPRVRLKVDERRERLLALGRELFSRRPYDALSVDEIAAAAGISKGLLYHYFPTKRDFYLATLRDVLAQLRAETAPEPSLPPIARLLGSLDAYLRFVDRHRALYAAVVRAGLGADAEVNAIVEEYRDGVMRWVLDALGVAAARPVVRAALRGWIGFVEGSSLDWVAHGDVGLDALRELLAQALRTAVLTAAQLDPDSGLLLPDDGE